MEAAKHKARVCSDGSVEWLGPHPPAGEAEVILLYTPDPHPSEDLAPQASAAGWPVLRGRWKDGSLRREDLYGDEER